MSAPVKFLGELLSSNIEQVLESWLDEAFGNRATTGSRATATADGRDVLRALQDAFESASDLESVGGGNWDRVTSVLTQLSTSRAAQGLPAGETSAFVLALKRPLFAAIQEQSDAEPRQQFEALWQVSKLVDRMAQETATAYQAAREEVIARQQLELLELSTPVVKLWDGVLAVPMIGTLDSSRTQLVMESLLQRIVETGSELAIIDITGVPTVDTLVAQHLLKTVTAIRLMGAECIISGVRPQIAQTIVHLGIDLQGIITKASLADALTLALRKLGYTFSRVKG